MNIVIIIDKSTFQQLSFDELRWLSIYYNHNITPILVMEVLGDLKKEFTNTEKPSEHRVKDFAKKLFPVETVVNQHYQSLLIQDLVIGNLSLDERPVVGRKKAVQSETGQKGVVIEETEEEKAIYKWKEGFFDEADHMLSSIWRETTTRENLLSDLKTLLKTKDVPNLTTFDQLWTYSMTEITNPQHQQYLLKFIIETYDIAPIIGIDIFAKWTQAGMPTIKEFAPYAFHCLLVDLLFLNGLACGLITTRPTNNVDKEYLYYLPFCNVFTSNDKFHKNIIPLFLNPHQKFITGDDLKKDLKGIVEVINTLDINQRKKILNSPPINEESITFNLWREYFDYPNSKQWQEDATLLNHDYALAKMQEFRRAMEGNNIPLESGNEEFTIKQSFLNMDDPCPVCGSNKRVVDCCIPMEEFMKLALQNQKRQIKGEIETSYNKANHVRFVTFTNQGLPAIIFAYKKDDIDSKGHLGLINNYKNEELKLIGTIKKNKIELSFIEIETSEKINLKPLACNSSQIESFVRNKYDSIAILWGLVDPNNKNDLIILTYEEGKPPSQIIIKGFELVS